MASNPTPDIQASAADPPLLGIRVLDLSQIVAGPFCTMMLADLGAEIVKVERPGIGDDTRHLGRFKDREQHEDFFFAVNRNKKSIELDLKDVAHRKVACELAAQAHVVVENFAPGTVERLGMSFADLHQLNPRLVYCSVSGFGQTGPYRDRLAVDPIIQSVAGLMSVTGFPNGAPVMVGAPLTDVMSGMFAAFSIVGALFVVRRDGQGQYIDVAMQAATISAIGPRMGDALQSNRAQGRLGNENPMRVPSDTYATKDDRFITITVVAERHWPAFCRALERYEWIEDGRFASMRDRVKNRAKLKRLIEARFRERTLTEWTPRLAAERVAFAPVKDFVEALADEQVAHRGLVRDIEHPTSGNIRVIGAPWIATYSVPPITPPPLLGEHTEEVLRTWLNWSHDDIARFMEAGSPTRKAVNEPGSKT
jgi:crotonobetainyl-CoA:carnitine CoA-transferase CaiB-like acyl-CoA transferase